MWDGGVRALIVDTYDTSFEEFILIPAKHHVKTKPCSNAFYLFLFFSKCTSQTSYVSRVTLREEESYKRKKKVIAAFPINLITIKVFIWNFWKSDIFNHLKTDKLLITSLDSLSLITTSSFPLGVCWDTRITS